MTPEAQLVSHTKMIVHNGNWTSSFIRLLLMHMSKNSGENYDHFLLVMCLFVHFDYIEVPHFIEINPLVHEILVLNAYL